MSSNRMFQATRQQQALMEQALLEDRERDYETEEALSQPQTDEEIEASRHGGRSRSAHSRVVAVVGVERSFQQRPLCAIPGCSWPVRVSEKHAFCSKTCSRLVWAACKLGLWVCLTRNCLSGLHSVRGENFGLRVPKSMRLPA